MSIDRLLPRRGMIRSGRYQGKLAHEWRELRGMGNGYTCVRCKKSAACCYGDERFVCAGSSA